MTTRPRIPHNCNVTHARNYTGGSGRVANPLNPFAGICVHSIRQRIAPSLKECKHAQAQSNHRHRRRQKKPGGQDDRHEAYQNLQKSALLDGISRTYKPKDDEGEPLPAEKKLVQQRVRDVTGSVVAALTELFDVVATQDYAAIAWQRPTWSLTARPCSRMCRLPHCYSWRNNSWTFTPSSRSSAHAGSGRGMEL